mmetsp:Transcript_70494/g.153104  ORF Transcript_70494/g.153104 Transcript_70494/m.153104 type:complete len:237 (+) Transcript_70494:640-1350(+)
MVSKPEAREMTKVGRTTLQSCRHNAEPLRSAGAGKKWLLRPLLLKFCCDCPREEVDDGVTQIAVCLGVPGAIEEVECSSHAGRQVLKQRNQGSLREEVRDVGEHHSRAMPTSTAALHATAALIDGWATAHGACDVSSRLLSASSELLLAGVTAPLRSWQSSGRVGLRTHVRRAVLVKRVCPDTVVRRDIRLVRGRHRVLRPARTLGSRPTVEVGASPRCAASWTCACGIGVAAATP